MGGKETVNKPNNYTIFTVCNLAYLPKALVLAESVIKHNNIKLKIYIIDKKVPIDIDTSDANIYCIEEIKIPNFYELAFKYDIIELSTSLKPFITLKLLKRFEKVIYFDSDTCLYHSVDPIINDLDKDSIILTHHYTTPQSRDFSESDTGMMRFGSFNLGFYAVKNSEQGFNFLKWWSDRCVQFSFMETQFGLSTDQNWVSIAPCFFQDYHVSFNLGYNVAPWNSYERFLEKDDLEYMNKRSKYEKNLKRPDLLELGVAYYSALSRKTSSVSLTKYAFDYMSGGEYISPTLRRAYACILKELPENHDPFDSQGVVGVFAKKNNLFEKYNMPYKTKGYSNLKEHQYMLNIIYILLRLVLRFIGPNRFYNLSRLLVYLSSYRQNRGLWKY